MSDKCHHYEQQPPPAGKCPDLPVCPVCGGLKCLCRPRFFAGQKVDEEDLNCLVRYVVEKNRLHNRYLHGWGVVCGLEVVCHPCPNLVTVRTGYALSPCGDDIIVCQDDQVDICDMLQKCKPATQPCDPLRATPPDDCEGATCDYILAICYDETPTRGIMPLKPAGTSGCSCGCQGESQSKNGKHNGKQHDKSCGWNQPNPPLQCEPTLICEGYNFIIYKAPAERETPDLGEWTKRFNACRQGLLEALAAGRKEVSSADFKNWFVQLKSDLYDFLSQYPTYNCTLIKRLHDVTLDTAAHDVDHAMFRSAVLGLTSIAATSLQYCFCATFQPPCPEPVQCNCVPLATVTVRKNDCAVLKICNWGPRRLVLTFPDLEYWLSPLGIKQKLQALLKRVCCGEFVEKEIRPQVVDRVPREMAAPAEPATGAAHADPFVSLFSHSWQNQAKSRVVDAKSLVLAALGFVGSDNQPFATSFEMEHALSFLLTNQLLRPVLEQTLPGEWTDLMRALSGGAQPIPKPDLSELKKTVEELRKTVQQHAEKLNKMSTKPKSPK